MQGFRELIRLHLAHEAERQAAERQAELRERIERMDEKLADDKAAVAAATEAFDQIAKNRKAVEGEIELLDQQRRKYRDQLMSAKTNEVYKTLLHEIETSGQRISEKETVVLELMEQADGASETLDAARAALAVTEKAAQDEIGQLEREIVELETKRTAASADAAARAEDVPANLLARYRRISGSRGGRGMTRAVDERCTECHVGMRPQVWVEILTKEDAFECQGCGRILFRDANLGDEARPVSGAGATEDATSAGSGENASP